MKKKFDYLVFIGRFQPFHIGHELVIREALDLSYYVIILVGSSNQPRTIKNPWAFKEREEMIYLGSNLTEEEKKRVIVMPLRDRVYNDQKWVADVQAAVEKVTHQNQSTTFVHKGALEAKELNFVQVGPPTRVTSITTTTPNSKDIYYGQMTKQDIKIGIIGHVKDESSYYLKMFPQWTLVEHDVNEMVSATDIRGLYFSELSLKFLKGLVSSHVFMFLEQFSKRPEFVKLKKEYEFIQKYKKAWDVAPYSPTFVTVDAVVVQAGHVLLVRRKSAPGEGLLALVGGFVDQNEYLIDAVLRELREETKLKVPAPVLKGSIKAVKVFDKPDRSLRGRTITHAYLIELPAGELPPVKAGDDASKAGWIPIADIKEEEMFEDHFGIIQYFLGSV